MSWTAKTQIGTNLVADDTEKFSSAVELKSDETAHVQVVVTFAATPIDDLEVRLYTSLDATSEAWDTEPWDDAVILDCATSPGRYSFQLSGVYKFRVGVKASGITDDHTVNIFYRTNGDYKDCNLDI